MSKAIALFYAMPPTPTARILTVKLVCSFEMINTHKRPNADTRFTHVWSQSMAFVFLMHGFCDWSDSTKTVIRRLGFPLVEDTHAHVC